MYRWDLEYKFSIEIIYKSFTYYNVVCNLSIIHGYKYGAQKNLVLNRNGVEYNIDNI